MVPCAHREGLAAHIPGGQLHLNADQCRRPLITQMSRVINDIAEHPPVGSRYPPTATPVPPPHPPDRYS
jgi:hypothetical protein